MSDVVVLPYNKFKKRYRKLAALLRSACPLPSYKGYLVRLDKSSKKVSLVSRDYDLNSFKG